MKTGLHYNFRKFYTLFFLPLWAPSSIKTLKIIFHNFIGRKIKIIQIKLLLLSCNFKKNQNANIFLCLCKYYRPQGLCWPVSAA